MIGVEGRGDTPFITLPWVFFGEVHRLPREGVFLGIEHQFDPGSIQLGWIWSIDHPTFSCIQKHEATRRIYAEHIDEYFDQCPVVKFGAGIIYLLPAEGLFDNSER